MTFRKYYNLERYLFDEVGPRFRRRGQLQPVDLYFILAWKSSRAKNTSKNRLVKKAGTFQNATSAISKALGGANSDEERLRILMDGWDFRLPTATAVLSVLYPESFTVYDVRVCSELGRFGELAKRRFSPRLWAHYQQFVKAVEAAVAKPMSLRDKDRYLWAKSVHAAALAELRLTKPSTRRAKTHARDGQR
jgi:hypothetical protein